MTQRVHTEQNLRRPSRVHIWARRRTIHCAVVDVEKACDRANKIYKLWNVRSGRMVSKCTCITVAKHVLELMGWRVAISS